MCVCKREKERDILCATTSNTYEDFLLLELLDFEEEERGEPVGVFEADGVEELEEDDEVLERAFAFPESTFSGSCVSVSFNAFLSSFKSFS